MFKTLTVAALLATGGLHAAAQEERHEIWFDTPASLPDGPAWDRPGLRLVDAGSGLADQTDKEWENRSLPLGNGSIGTNLMGSIAAERLTLNEKSLWRGGPGTAAGPRAYWDVNKPGALMLDSIRQAFVRGDRQLAAQLTQEHFNSEVPYESTGEEAFRFGNFTTLGELRIATGLSEDGVEGYRRTLSLDSALATVRFTQQGTTYERRAFISYPDQVLVLHFAADRPAAQHLSLTYLPNPVSTGGFADEGDGFVFNARLDNNGMAFCVRVKALARGGCVACRNGVLTVEGADEVTFLLTADTDYRPNYAPDPDDARAYVGVDPQKTTARWMRRAARRGYDALLSRHEADYGPLFRSVRLSLPDSATPLPTDKRLARYRQGALDHALETLYFQYGRYLLIASSRPGNLPANLQGIWANNVDGPWRVDYHNNINLQMNYWPAFSCNLTECAAPLTDFIRLLEKPGRVTARSYFGARGWTASISANPFGFTAPLEGRDMTWNYNPMAGPWLATHLWEYYDFTRDRRFLRHTAWPLLRESARFTVDFLWKRPDGWYAAVPSTSPEHGPVDDGVTFQHAVAREILADALAAADVLGKSDEETRSWQGVLDSIAPYRIGRFGQLMEWNRDIDDPQDHHRHVNHLFGLHPGSSILALRDTALATAARVTLNHRGDVAQGWSMGWKLNQWARLLDGERSYTLLRTLIARGTTDNLWDVHPPFQIDGNFGGTAGMAEMLLQSQGGLLHLLPALPRAWADGRINGLLARGGFRVDMRWTDGSLSEAVVHATADAPCHVLYRGMKANIDARRGHTYRIVPTGSGLRVEPLAR